jgi:hypothetical protein
MKQLILKEIDDLIIGFLRNCFFYFFLYRRRCCHPDGAQPDKSSDTKNPNRFCHKAICYSGVCPYLYFHYHGRKSRVFYYFEYWNNESNGTN